MPGIPPPKHNDNFAYAFAVGLALGCLGFASYKVVTLRAMENPPADLGLNFPAPQRKLIADDSILVDSSLTEQASVKPAQQSIDVVAFEARQLRFAGARAQHIENLAGPLHRQFRRQHVLLGPEILAVIRHRA